MRPALAVKLVVMILMTGCSTVAPEHDDPLIGTWRHTRADELHLLRFQFDGRGGWTSRWGPHHMLGSELLWRRLDDHTIEIARPDGHVVNTMEFTGSELIARGDDDTAVYTRVSSERYDTYSRGMWEE